MDIYPLLASGHSKEIAESIAQSVIDGKESIDTLFNILFDEDVRMCQRVSWPLQIISERRDELLHPHIPMMISQLKNSKHDGIPRNIFRFWQNIDFPEEMIGQAYECAFQWLADSQNAIAIRVFAMTTCANIAEKFPELAFELILIIEDQVEIGSTGFRNRASK
jgi:hypothetical protein